MPLAWAVYESGCVLTPDFPTPASLAALRHAKRRLAELATPQRGLSASLFMGGDSTPNRAGQSSATPTASSRAYESEFAWRTAAIPGAAYTQARLPMARRGVQPAHAWNISGAGLC